MKAKVDNNNRLGFKAKRNAANLCGNMITGIRKFTQVTHKRFKSLRIQEMKSMKASMNTDE